VFANPTPRALAALLARGETRESLSDFADDYDYQAIDRILQENTLDAFRHGALREPGNIMLTGATGFLGIHILNGLIRHPGVEKIYCLMRRGRRRSPEERLKHQLFYYFEDSCSELFGSRIIAVEGDVTHPESFAGLKDADIHTVINCAANVTHFTKDDSIFRTNTAGVEHLIDLCLATGARLIQISNASVAGFSVDGRPAPGEMLTEQRLYLGQNMENQYVYSKFLAERALLQACAARGLDAKVMRVGNLMARNSDGEFQMNAAANSFLGRLRAYSVVGCFPYCASTISMRSGSSESPVPMNLMKLSFSVHRRQNASASTRPSGMTRGSSAAVKHLRATLSSSMPTFSMSAPTCSEPTAQAAYSAACERLNFGAPFPIRKGLPCSPKQIRGAHGNSDASRASAKFKSSPTPSDNALSFAKR